MIGNYRWLGLNIANFSDKYCFLNRKYSQTFEIFKEISDEKARF
jgi:hypothetical protein